MSLAASAQPILRHSYVRSADPNVSVSGLEAYILQMPTKKLFRKNKTVLDTVLVRRTSDDLLSIIKNRGYLDATIDTVMDIKKGKVSLVYLITPRQQYHLADGTPFSVDSLQKVRQQLTEQYNNTGYRHFIKEMITYNVDTCQATHEAQVTQHISPLPTRYTIRNVTHQSDFLRERTLDVHTLIRPGDYYNEKAVQQTYNRLGSLRAVRNVNISFTEDGDRIDALIRLNQRKTHSIQIQPEGTNTAGDLGAALSLTYENRNIFRGSEIFSLSFRGAYESIQGLEGYSGNDYTELGVEGKLTFPTIIIPGVSRYFQRRHTGTTDLLVSYNRQNRPEFYRRVFSGTWRYRWKNSRGNVSHQYDFLGLNYVSMPWISDTFRKDYLENTTTRNAILRYNYEDLFIMKMGYGISYTDADQALKVNVETAGNFLYGLANIFRFPTNSDGNYKAFLIAFAQYAKTDIDYTRQIQLTEPAANNGTLNGVFAPLTLVLHARLGVAIPYGNSNILPFEKRYFAGGANSVRGWNIRTLGPGRFHSTDGKIDFINQTGDMKIDLNAELRTDLFWRFQGAFFIDAGNVWTIRSYEEQGGGQFQLRSLWKDMAVAYGIGLRMNFNYFVLRLDLGMKAINPDYSTSKEHYPIAHPKLSRDYALHFAVGLPF